MRTAFLAAQRPTSPAISADGTFVTTGSEGHGLFARSLRDFPTDVSLGASRAVIPGDEVVDPTRCAIAAARAGVVGGLL